MKKENPSENWAYASVDSEQDYDSKNKVFEAWGYCRDKKYTFVRENLFIYDERTLLVLEIKDRENISTLIIPGFVVNDKIIPVKSLERIDILNYLNRDNIDCGIEKMSGSFWNIEVETKNEGISYKSYLIIQ